MSTGEAIAKIAGSISALDATQWNRLAGDNPFLSHEFLSALETSGSVGPGTGWQPVPIVIEAGNGQILAAIPSYLKSHSQGEYVFDHSWADAYQQAGGQYYPKLQIATPFTPATGPRLLLSDETLAPALLNAAEKLCEGNGFSSAHATFVDPAQISLFEAQGWLLRNDIQFHWLNREYEDFDDFLGTLASRKRRTIKKERRAAREGIEIRILSGEDIRPEHWDAFWIFYQDTGARKWGSPYLTREAFTLFGECLANRILLFLALEDGKPIAGALNFIGGDTLYGRYWGCRKEKRFLHFELCYYQAIEIAIERGLGRVEAGAQGAFKLARGYEPQKTWSAHRISDPGLRGAVQDFLCHERDGVALDQLYLAGHTPFRKG